MQLALLYMISPGIRRISRSKVGRFQIDPEGRPHLAFSKQGIPCREHCILEEEGG